MSFAELIRLKVPWSNLFNANIQLELDGLYILLGPINDRPYSKEKDQRLENAIKQAKLQANEKSTMEYAGMYVTCCQSRL